MGDFGNISVCLKYGRFLQYFGVLKNMRDFVDIFGCSKWGISAIFFGALHMGDFDNIFWGLKYKNLLGLNLWNLRERERGRGH